MRLVDLVGRVIEVAERDYLYGAGRLRLQVIAVEGEVVHQGARWAVVQGRDLDATWMPVHQVLVRVSVLFSGGRGRK